MKYENRSVTSDGMELLAQAAANKQAPIIDKMLVLNTDIPVEKTIDSMNLNDFSNALSFDVNNVSQNDNSFTASAVISNDGINQDYTAKLIGVTGFLNGSNDRKLFSVAQGNDPFIIEKQDGTPVKLVPSLTTGFSNSQNVQLTVKDDVYVTAAELENKIGHIDLSKYETTADSQKAHDGINGRIDELVNNNSSIFAGWLQDGDDLFDLMEKEGTFFNFNKQLKNSPVNYTVWSKITVDKNNGFTSMTWYDSSYNIFYISATGWPKNWGNWHKIATTEWIQNTYNLTNENGKLMYAGKPVLIANAPNAPKLTAQINADTGNLDYTITPPSVDGGASITRYQLSYKKQSDSDWQIIDVDADSHNGTLSNLDKGTTYQLKAVAINYAGAGTPSKSVSTKVGSLLKAPNLNIDLSGESINYEIALEDDNNPLKLINYTVYYKKSDTDNWQSLTSTSANGSIQNIEFGKKYDVKVTATNWVGEGQASVIREISIVPTKPSISIDNELIKVDCIGATNYTLRLIDSNNQSDNQNINIENGIWNFVQNANFNSFDIVAVALNDAGQSPESNTLRLNLKEYIDPQVKSAVKLTNNGFSFDINTNVELMAKYNLTRSSLLMFQSQGNYDSSIDVGTMKHYSHYNLDVPWNTLDYANGGTNTILNIKMASQTYNWDSNYSHNGKDGRYVYAMIILQDRMGNEYDLPILKC